MRWGWAITATVSVPGKQCPASVHPYRIMNACHQSRSAALAVIGVLGALWVGCGSAQERTRTAKELRDDVYPQMERLSSIDKFDEQAQKYMTDIMSSEDFKVQARLSPFLERAYSHGLISKSEAVRRFEEMKDRGPEHADYWQTVIGSFHTVKVEQ